MSLSAVCEIYLLRIQISHEQHRRVVVRRHDTFEYIDPAMTH